jgi:hypothetical protein
LYGTHIIPYSGGNAAIRNTDLSAGFTATASTAGLFINTRISSAQSKYFYNASLFNTVVSPSISKSNEVYFLSARNSGGTATLFSTKQLAFNSIGEGLTDTDAANLYTRVQTFNQALGRQVGVPIVSDSDAQAFLNSAEITDLTQANAINTLVTDLKAQGLWTKMKAVYPFVGGTASTHKWNLKDPRDLDAAYRLVFNGGWTHSSTGALPNGTNGWADTRLNAASVLSLNSSHLSYYSRTDANSLTIDIGNYNGLNSGNHLFLRYLNSAYVRISDEDTSAISRPNSLGYYIGSRTSSTIKSAYINNVKTSLNINSVSLANNNIALAAMNDVILGRIYFSNRQTAFASIGDGLNDTESAALYTAVQTYQTTLSRNV